MNLSPPPGRVRSPRPRQRASYWARSGPYAAQAGGVATTRSTPISRKPQPDRSQAPVVQRIRIRYAKRGHLRFTSHRDFARAFERAVRRADLPVAFSQGFTPHPKISYASAAPTGAASEAEYLEIGLRERVDPQRALVALDAALSPGLDVLAAVEGKVRTSLADRIDASRWRIELEGADRQTVRDAVAAFMAAPDVAVDRLTKQGWRRLDVRRPVVGIEIVSESGTPAAEGTPTCAIIELVVRQVTPSVRPDDVLAGLRVVADLVPPVPPRVIRLAQGRLTEQGEIVDPLWADHDGTAIGLPST